jgi:hypothetical protein
MSNSPPFFGNNYGVPPSPPASNLRRQYNKEIDRLSEKVDTELPNGEKAKVYRQSNILQLEELYDIIKERSALYELKTRIKNILKEDKEINDRIGRTYGIGFLKKRKTKKTRKPVKGRKSRKSRKLRK